MTAVLRTLFAAAALAAAFATIAAANAADYPVRPIRMLVGFGAGSATDIVARTVGQKVSERVGQTVVVDNRTGAGGTLAAEATARATPDGYTIFMASSAFVIAPAVYSNLTFDAAKDFTPIIYIGALPAVLVVSSALPAKTLKEFVQHAKSSAKPINYGSSGVGGSIHLASELLMSVGGFRMNHVPYRGNAQAAVGLLGGEISVLIDTLLLAAQSTKATPDRVRALAITGRSRSPLLPDVPTFAEAGMPQFDASITFGVLGPAGMRKDVVTKLNREIAESLKAPDVRTRLVTAGGLDIIGGTPEEFGKIVQTELAKWKTIARDQNIKAE